VHPEGVLAGIVQLDPPGGVEERPWPEFPRSEPIEWARFERYPNYLAAEIVAGLLEGEGVPAVVEPMNAFPGGASFAALWVPRALLHRARWILAWPPPSEAELALLATGELSANEGPK
jgi:hypothetical protein